MKLYRYLMLLLTVSVINTVSAQDEAEKPCPWNCAAGEETGWCWGADPKTAKEKNVLFTDSYNMKQYKEAVEPLEWLLANTPNLNKAIYVQGEKIYTELEKAATDAAEKVVYQDKLLALYDTRIQHFCEEKKNLQNKGLVAYPFLIKRGKEYYEPLYQLYKKIYDLCGKETKRTNISYYFETIGLKKTKLNQFTDDQVIEEFENLVEICEEKAASAKDAKEKESWEKTADALEVRLQEFVKIDCDFVRTKWGERLKTETTNLKLAKEAVRFMLKDSCTTDPLFLQALENMVAIEPSVGTYRILIRKFLAEKNYVKAEEYANKAIEISKDDPVVQAEFYKVIADIRRDDNKFSEARSLYLKVAELDASRANDCYSNIGRLYMSSFNACLAPNSDPVKDKAVYLAAYDMYAKAGDNAGMASARSRFPSMEEIFSFKYTEGQSIGVGCWIGGATTVRKR